MKDHVPRKIKHSLTSPFAKFLYKRIAFYLVVAFVAITFTFLLPRLMPGNPVDLMITHQATTPIHGGSQTGSAVVLEEMRNTMMAYFGLDKPLPEQYVGFWGQLFRGNLGTSFGQYPRPVLELVSIRLPFTLVLVVPVILITFFLGNWIGSRSAFLKGKKNDFSYFLSVLANQMPFFWLAMIIVAVFSVALDLFPSHGWITRELLPTLRSGISLRAFLDIVHHYILPFLVLLIVYTGGWAIGMRAMTLYEKNSDYILYSERLGFRKDKLRSYAQRNAILPQFTGLNLMFNTLVGATLIIEIVFGWPGIGYLLYTAVLNLDFPVVMGGFLITMGIVIFGNFLIDVAYGFVDPRIRTGYLGR